MPDSDPQPTEQQLKTLKRWRRAFQLLHAMLAGTLMIWTLVSLLSFFLSDPKPAAARSYGKPMTFAACRSAVKRLAGSLRHEVHQVHHQVLKLKLDPEIEWKNWSDGWRHRWKAIGVRCSFDKDSDTMPEVLRESHRKLAELQGSYSTLMGKLVEKHVRELGAIERKLKALKPKR